MLKKKLSQIRQWVHYAKGISLERLRYHYCLATGQTYFGAFMGAKQGWPKRYIAMTDLIETELKGWQGSNFKLLEIGSWAGGSALLWGKALKGHPELKPQLLCVDPWVFYEMTSDYGLSKKLMEKGFKHDRIYRLFHHNITAAGLNDILVEIRGSSEQTLPLMRAGSFNWIYVDGNHSYEYVKTDLGLAAPLVAEGGIICGDDLEVQLDQIDRDNAMAFKFKDFILDPKSKTWFHPGVALGVGEFFQRHISDRDGFWALRKRNGQWEDIQL
jgi:hypothetical protein